jgi:adenylate cyclase
MERRLAAILAADVVGYSRLIGEDEAGTLAAIKAHRKELFEPKVRQYRGRIVKLMGDGALMEFPSAVDAVTFAIEVQCAMAERNRDVPKNLQILYRIGINVGDIIIEDDDIFGDGVNIAARIEGLAEPGGICIARNVLNQVKGKLDLTFKALGRRKVKNITQPVTVYRLVLDDKAEQLVTGIQETASARSGWRPYAAALLVLLLFAAGIVWWQPWASGMKPAPEETESAEKASLPLPDKPSIAVLPFTNMSDDKEQEYFSDGMTEDLITDLSRISGLAVISRTSTFAYKGQATDVRTIGKELGARYVVEGSVRKLGDRVRINAQLIDSHSGNHVWADRFDRSLADLFSLQDEVRGKIVQALKVKLSAQEEERLSHRLTESTQAYDLYLRGLQQESFFTREANLESRRLFEQAIELDPEFAAAYASLAQAYSLAQENGWTDKREEFVNKALALAKKAVELDAELPRAHWALGRIYTRAPFRNHDLAIKELKRVIELDPNYADGYAFLANTLLYVGKAAQALGVMEQAMRINPRFPFWYLHILGQSQYLLTRYEAAAENFRKAIERNPTVSWPRRWLLATYGQLGMKDDAEWEISELEGLGQPVTLTSAREISPFADHTYLKHYLEGLHKAGVPEQ